MAPYMGWSSWNACGVAISEELILRNARAMIDCGLRDAGYTFVNIDDGFFDGRDSEGNIVVKKRAFPDGMRHTLDRLRSMGFKTGIYSDAGKNTCGYYHDGERGGRGAGLEGHEERDIRMYLGDWGADLLKVDWCGAWLRLNKRKRYTDLSRIVRATNPEAIYNVCCWEWPGEWVTEAADAWRTGPDLEPRFPSILNALEKAAPLSEHATAFRWNDLDMLQVGNGMTDVQDRSHFSMWCMMNTPLVLGCDVSAIRAETLDIVSDPELIAINQDPLGRQAKRVRSQGGVSLWSKPLLEGNAYAVLNETDSEKRIRIPISDTVTEVRDVALKRWDDVYGSVTVDLEPFDCRVFRINRA
nr:alpha-galactosidase [Oceanusvirus sp.]